MNTSFLFRFASALDPRRRVAVECCGIVQGDAGQVAFEEPAQVIRSAMEPQLNDTSIDGNFHLGRATERETAIGAVTGFRAVPGFLAGDHITECLNTTKS